MIRNVRPIFAFSSLVCLFVAALFAATPARAQFNASVQGTIQDPKGAAVAGAKVTLTNQDTQVSAETTSSNYGFYHFSEVAPGKYTVTVEAPGFEKKITQDLDVRAETPRGLDITLEIGAVTQSVTVNGGAIPELQSEDASITGTLTTTEVQDLPKFNRDPYELVRLAPGIFGDGARLANANSAGFPNGPGNNNGSAGTGGSNVAIFQTENQQPISANGQRVSANDYTVDGVQVNSLNFGGAAVLTPSPDSVQEITVVSNDYDATDGRNSGAHIKVITKSGTNTFHGGGFFHFQDPGLNAFNKYNGFDTSSDTITTARNDNAFRQFGAHIGGPIIHEKLFFFFNYEGLRSKSESFEDQWIDTPQFDQTLVADRPGTPVATTLSAAGVRPRVQQLLPTDCTLWIMANQPCAVVNGGVDIGSPGGTFGTYIPSFTPGPNQFSAGGLDGIPDLVFAELALPVIQSGDQYNARVDYTRGRNTFSASTFLTRFRIVSSDGVAQGRPMSDITDKRFNPSGFLSWSTTISPSLINEARFNFTRFAFNELTSNPGVNFGIPRTEIQGLPLPGAQRIIFGAQQGDTTPGIFGQNTFAFRDLVTKIHGAHVMRFGIDGDRAQDNSNLNGNARPDYVFQGPWNLANGTPIFEAIGVNPSTGGPPTTKPLYFRETDIGLFFQDDWKFRPNLTINLGLRWEYFGPPTEAKHHLENIVPTRDPVNGLIDAVATNPDQMWNTTWRNFGPRIGFAWSPSRFNEKAVVRGGFGIAFNRFTDIVFDNTRDNPPFVANYGLCCGTAAGEFGSPFLNGQILYATGSSNSPLSYPPNPNLVTPINPMNNLPEILPGQGAPNVFANPVNSPTTYVYLYSLQLQYSLPANWVATIGYTGSSGHDLIRIRNLQFFFPMQSPNLNSVFDMTPDTTSSFNALLTQIQHRFSHGLLTSFAYTYSRSIDEISAEGPGFVTNQTFPTNLAFERGPSDYDATHYIQAFAIWDLPIFTHRNDWIGRIAGGWQFAPIFVFHSGFPFTPVANNLCPVFGATSLCPVRPIAFSDDVIGRHDTNAFLPPNSKIFPSPLVSFGLQQTGTAPDLPAIGRNSFRGPRYSDFDLSFAKNFALPTMKFVGEGSKIELRLNMFNAFNKLNLAPFTFGGNSTVIANCCGAAGPPSPLLNPNFGLANFSNGGLAGRTLEIQGSYIF